MKLALSIDDEFLLGRRLTLALTLVLGGCHEGEDAQAPEDDALEDASSGCPVPQTPGPEPELLATQVPAPAAITIDEQFVWFAAYAGGSVGRVARDGSAPPEVFADALVFPTGLAVDQANVYVATAAGLILRIDRESRARAEFVTGQARPHDLLRVDDRLYWSNEGTVGGTIHAPEFQHDAGFSFMQIDGHEPQVLLTGEDWARGLTIADRVAYGAVSGADGHRIMAIPLDGGAAWVVATVAGAVRDVAAHDGQVYWTRPLACAIRRAPARGGAVEMVAQDQNVPQMIWADEHGLVWTNAGAFGDGYLGSQVVVAEPNAAPKAIAAGHNAFALAVSGAEVFFSNNDIQGDIARAPRW